MKKRNYLITLTVLAVLVAMVLYLYYQVERSFDGSDRIGRTNYQLLTTNY